MDLRTEQLITRGRQAFDRRDYAAALADLREALADHPDFADVRHLAAVCLSFLGQPEAALEEFDRALSLNEGYIEAHLNRALTLNELGRYEEAREAFERAWHIERQDAGAFSAPLSALLANGHAAVGDLYLQAGAAAQAAEQYRIALGMRPHFVDIRNKLAQALFDLGELPQAEAELRQVLSDNARFASARVKLGLIYYRRGETDQAIREWEEALASAPANAQARAFLAMIGRPVPPPAPRADA
ncbi:MAG TPA: tetratricopeptide repeat protein [Longimicrobiales bacterium]